MRVIQANKFHYARGGSERYYFDLAEALVRHGHEVDFLSMSHPRNVPAGPRDEFVSEVDYRARHGLWDKLRFGSRVIYNREAASKARQLARGGPRPVAHLHNIAHQLSPSIIRAWSGEGVPIVQTMHDYKLICPSSVLMTDGLPCERCQGGRFHQAALHRCLLDSRGASVLGAAEAYVHRWWRTYDRVARFICPSQFLLEKLAAFGIDRARLIHLPHFLPLGRYRAAESPAQEPVAVFAGRLSREKGIATLIEAVSHLPAGRLKLWILGEGPLRSELEAKAAKLGPDLVQFLGYRSGEELHDTIRQAAFAVVPSEWYENLPYAVMEPFALGRPVLGARIGGIPELVEDGVTGRLFDSGNVESLVEALLWMTGPDANLRQLGCNARQRIEREHGEQRHIERLEEIYQQLLG